MSPAPERIAGEADPQLDQIAHRQVGDRRSDPVRQGRVEADALGRQHAQGYGQDDPARPQGALLRDQVDTVRALAQWP